VIFACTSSRFLCGVASWGLVLLVLAGCKPKADAPAAVAAEAAASATGRYKLTGTIVSVDAERGTLLIDHDEIPDFMAAMTMEFKTGAGDVANARPGQRIRGVIFQSADGFQLEQIWPEDQAGERVIDEAGRALRQDTVTRGAGVFREIGERLPDFALYDQTGAVVPASRFRGR
jgi:protein SCO1